MISIPKNILVYKSGIFFESKGGSYTNDNLDLIQTDNMGNIIGTTKASLSGLSRLNYLTIPLTIGTQTKGRIRLGIDVGGFVSLPIGEKHQSTFNGVTTDFEPLSKIGPNVGVMANVGAKIPINSKTDFALDARLLSSLSDAMKDQVGKSFNQGIQLLVGLNIRINQ
jgi:hypothetical protein